MPILGEHHFYRVSQTVSYKDWNLCVLFFASHCLLYWRWRAPCTDTGLMKSWCSREWLVPKEATTDAFLKTALLAARQAEEHECLENFRYNGVKIFDPHKVVA